MASWRKLRTGSHGCKIGSQNGTLVNWTKDQNLRSPGGLILTHTHMENLSARLLFWQPVKLSCCNSTQVLPGFWYNSALLMLKNRRHENEGGSSTQCLHTRESCRPLVGIFVETSFFWQPRLRMNGAKRLEHANEGTSGERRRLCRTSSKCWQLSHASYFPQTEKHTHIHRYMSIDMTHV